MTPRQVTTLLPFEMDMVFETGALSAAISISGERFTSELASRVNQFDTRFENTFQLKEKVLLVVSIAAIVVSSKHSCMLTQCELDV